MSKRIMDEGFIITFLLKWSGIKDKVMRLMNIGKRSNQSRSKKEVTMAAPCKICESTPYRIVHFIFSSFYLTVEN